MDCPIDFSLLLQDPNEGWAVHCPSIDDAATFVKWARMLYPDRVNIDWFQDEYRYYVYRQETVYTFVFNIVEATEWSRPGSLMFGSLSGISSSYKIIEFDDIYNVPELRESDRPIDFLIS